MGITGNERIIVKKKAYDPKRIREHSRKLWIYFTIVIGMVLAMGLIGGAFSFWLSPRETILVNGEIYVDTNDSYYSKPEGASYAGPLALVEDITLTDEPNATEDSTTRMLFVAEGKDEEVYVSASGRTFSRYVKR